MRNKRISSETKEYPSPRVVFQTLLSRMVEQGCESSWMHIEVVGEGGWFVNLLHGKEPWIEVAFLNRLTLQLNLGFPKAKRSLMPGIPDKWRKERNGVWTLPVTDAEELTSWAEIWLATVSGNRIPRVCGWIEGL
jgi:hypothetical protein